MAEVTYKGKTFEVDEDGYKLKEVYELFPSGPGKGACKMAGLPKPTGCV